MSKIRNLIFHDSLTETKINIIQCTTVHHNTLIRDILQIYIWLYYGMENNN